MYMSLLVFLGLAASALNVCHVNVISGTKEMEFTVSGSMSNTGALWSWFC